MGALEAMQVIVEAIPSLWHRQRLMALHTSVARLLEVNGTFLRRSRIRLAHLVLHQTLLRWVTCRLSSSTWVSQVSTTPSASSLPAALQHRHQLPHRHQLQHQLQALSPIPGGEPSAACLSCWQSACSAKDTGCGACMLSSKDSCVAICKPSLFGQKMIDWFCDAQSEVVV